jgi:hypothetical protein
VIVAPPLSAGGVNGTLAVVFPGVAVPIVGAPGTVAAIVAVAAEVAGVEPIVFVAVTTQVIVLPASAETSV